MTTRPPCTKRKFWSRAEAQRFARTVAKGRGGGKQRIYQCDHPDCALIEAWHLTTKPYSTFYREVQQRNRAKRKRGHK